MVGPGAETGEGPLWDARDNALWWVDIPGRRVHRFDPATDEDESVDTEMMVGALALRASGGLVAATEHGLAVFDWPSGRLDPIVDFCKDDPDIRCNDAAVDPAGRLWVGTLSLSSRTQVGTLFRVDGDHSVTTMVEGVDLCNGIDWSPDHTTMYFVESMAGTVWAFPFDLDAAALGERRVFARYDAATQGIPDGLTVDAAGSVWVAFFRGACLRRHHPDGSLAEEIPVPTWQVTCPAFAGPDLADLYVTSASHGLTDAERADHPLAGALFRARAAGRGRPVTAWAG